MQDTVSIQDLSAFQTWRRDPFNDQAYREVEAMWNRGEALRADPEIARALAAALKSRPPGRRVTATVTGFGAAAAMILAVSFGVWDERGRASRGAHLPDRGRPASGGGAARRLFRQARHRHPRSRPIRALGTGSDAAAGTGFFLRIA